jgi:hypothetical protein
MSLVEFHVKHEPGGSGVGAVGVTVCDHAPYASYTRMRDPAAYPPISVRESTKLSTTLSTAYDVDHTQWSGTKFGVHLLTIRVRRRDKAWTKSVDWDQMTTQL